MGELTKSKNACENILSRNLKFCIKTQNFDNNGENYSSWRKFTSSCGKKTNFFCFYFKQLKDVQHK